MTSRRAIVVVTVLLVGLAVVAGTALAVATDAASLHDRLAELGVDEEQVRSVGYDVHAVRSSRDQEEPDRYVARQRLEVTLDDVERAGTVTDSATVEIVSPADA